MTPSPPDVQNVPDVWGLLEHAFEELNLFAAEGHSFRKHPFTRSKINDALAQRDRFVLVPKEPRNVSEALHMIGEHQTQITRLQQYVLGDPRESVVLAAAPTPEGKP